MTDAQPHSLEAEQQLLGAILLNNDLHAMVADMLTADHFFDPLHADIWNRIGQRIANGHLASPVTMKLDMDGHEGLKEVGGPGYLVRMAGAAASSGSIREYAGLIIEAACRRTLDRSLAEGRLAISEGQGSQEVLARLQVALQGLPEASGGESSYRLASAIMDAAEQANRAYQGEAVFLRTGVASLDGVIRGLAPGDLCVLGGATSMGKTSLALHVANDVARREGHGVVFVSLEMSRIELAQRIVSAEARVPYSDLRDAATMSEDDFRKWIMATRPASEANLRIVPRHIRDVPAIYAAAKRAALDFPARVPSLLVVDYAQLIRGQGKGRYEQMTDVSISLKHLAGLLGCPVMALCQLSRELGNREDKRPHLFDLKESGQFENDADQVVFCHREGYWLERLGPKADAKGNITMDARNKWDADVARHKNRMDLIVRKNRHGRLATALVGFHEPTMRFWQTEADAF